MNDLEDGEIAESGDSEPELAVKPKHSLQFDNVDVFRPRPANPSGDAGYRTALRHYDDSSDASDSNSEEEFNTSPVKAKRGRPQFPVPSHFGNGDSHNIGFTQAAGKFQKKPMKTTWNEVVLEQTLDETIRKVNTVEKDSDDDDDRGVESYNYKSKFEVEDKVVVHEGRDVIDYGDDLFANDDDEMKDEKDNKDNKDDKDDEIDAGADICDIEGFGTGKSKQISVKHRLGLKVDEAPEPSLEDLESFGTGQVRKRTIKNDRKRSVRDRLGPKADYQPFSTSRKATFNFECNLTSTPEEVACALIKALGEPDYQTELFLRVITTVGIEKTIEAYHSAENIEQNGGMLILNQTRRRSPGGVFLQLIKTDKDATKEMVKTMFPFHHNQKKKKNKNRNRRPKQDQDDNLMDTDTKEMPSKAEVLLAFKTPSDLDSSKSTMEADRSTVEADRPTVEADRPTMAPYDDIDLDNQEVDIHLDFPDS